LEYPVTHSVAGSRLISLGHYQPDRVLGNNELAGLVDTSDEWIRSRVGIITRRVAAPAESVADLATAAAAKTMARSGTDPTDIDLVVVATCTAVDRMPNTAARVAEQLAVPDAATLDVNVACSGFCYALAIADHAIRGGASRNAIVIGADKITDFVDWSDRSTCVLFGDGAGAVMLAPATTEDQIGVGPVVWGSCPDGGRAITLESGDPQVSPLFRQNGTAVYRWTTTAVPKVAERACAAAGVEPADLAGVVVHQANLRIIDGIVRKLGIRAAVVATDVAESGNTSAASVPLALAKLVERGALTGGGPVLLLGFGAGLSFASQVVHCP
jgi:3-oxoacyl-[acyl-carrier-protein] synthase-3